MHRRLWLPVASGLLMLAAPVAADASVGVGVQAGPVRLAGAAHPGGTYTLPPVYVVNTGTRPESVAIRVERISRGTGRTVPPSWIRVSALPSQLGHGQSALRRARDIEAGRGTPSLSSDTSTKWTMTITRTPVPSQG